MRACAACQASMADDAVRCAACGAPAPPPPGLLDLTIDVDALRRLQASGGLTGPSVPTAPIGPPRPARPPPEPFGPGTVVAGKYHVLETVGTGGMGEVWKARHEGLDALVCVKVLRGDFATDREMVARFEAEARSASRLRHPNSIQMVDFGQLRDGTCYLVMEYVNGRSLSAVLAADGPMPQKRVCHIGAQLLAALQAAHDAGVIHRDLKPGNIMLERIGNDPDFVKVLDFGIAKMADRTGPSGEVDPEATARTSEREAIVGTPAYMSPEQGAGREVDGRADLYSVGVLLYRMTTGLLPFDGRSASELFRQHANQTPTAPRTRNPRADCSAAFEALILRALEKDPARRPQRAEEFRRELLALVDEGVRPAVDPASLSLDLPSFDDERTRAIEAPPPEPPPAPPIVEPPKPPPPPAPQRPVTLTGEQQKKLDEERRKARLQRRWGRWLRVGVTTLVLGGGAAAYWTMVPPETRQQHVSLVSARLAGVTSLFTGQTAASEPASGGGAAAGARGLLPPAPPEPRCPAGMVLVRGDIFPFGDGKRRMLVSLDDTCVDRFEFPNQPGSLPRIVSDATEAAAACADAGKRLCGEEEWERACKGPSDLAYPYGPDFDATACNGRGSGAGQAGLSGSHPRCLSGFGTADMLGNVAEWTAAAEVEGAIPRIKGGGALDAASCGTTGRTSGPAGFRCCATPH